VVPKADHMLRGALNMIKIPTQRADHAAFKRSKMRFLTNSFGILFVYFVKSTYPASVQEGQGRYVDVLDGGGMLSLFR
jgi:hypothetical protein